jgi:hypothetical protein
MKLKHAIRGLVWIAIGAGVYGYGVATDTPLVVRGTSVPWGLAVAGVGVLLMAWDLVTKRKEL